MSRLVFLSEALVDPDVRRWSPPAVDFDESAVEPEDTGQPPPTPEEIAAIEEAARRAGAEAGFREGHEAGYAEGRALAEQEALAEQRARAEREREWRVHEEQRLRSAVAALESIARELADPLASSADALEPELLALVSALARRVVMAELSTRPELIQGVLRAALEQLPSRNHAIRVHVHPDDQATLERYADANDERITWIADTTLERGGCILTSGPSRIDATLETRLRQGIEAIWGELSPPEPPTEEPPAMSVAADPELDDRASIEEPSP